MENDLINRQMAISTIMEQPPESHYPSWYAGVIEEMPAAEWPKTGKWIDKSGGIEGAWNYCSVCGEQAIDLYDYCPNCGAKMKEGDLND